MHYHLTMLAFRVLPILAALYGCAGTPQVIVAPQVYHASDGSPTQTAFAEATANEFRGYLEVDMTRVDLHFFADWHDQLDRCHGFAACTKPQVMGYQVNTYWPDTGWEVGHPYMLAHELCHVFYLENGEGGDPNHTHADCFARPDHPEMFGPGEGYAWQTAQTILGEYHGE